MLDVSKKSMRFDFTDDNMDMFVTQQLVISNHGNATARYNWNIQPGAPFIPEPEYDEVAAGCSKNVMVTFKPHQQKSEEENLILQIEDGKRIEVKCVGIVNEAKCAFVEKVLDFGNVPVGLKAKDMMLNIKNQLRQTSIFHVECDAPELTISPMKGKILGDQKMIFTVGFISHVPKNFQTEIVVHIRGGKPLRMLVKASAIIPEIQIEQPEVDFGGITLGDSKTLPITIHNHSDITAKLILDIRDYPEFEIILPPSDPSDDVVSEMMVPINEEENYMDIENMNPEDIQDPLNEDESEEEDEDEEDQNRHI